MTREEALQRIVDNNFAGEYGFDLQILIDCMAAAREIILNSQFPIEDCISRSQALSDYADWYGYGYRDNTFYKRLKNMPSVQPKPKTGHWEWVQYDSNPEIGNFHCSECNFMPASFNWARKHLNYCPHCGAKMEDYEKT